MAVKTAGALVLLVCALLSARASQHWRSDRALWDRAVAVNPRLPRPLLNAAVQHRKDGDIEGAVGVLMRAGAAGDAEMRARVRQQVLWMQAFGHDVCSRPDVQSYCF